MAIEKEKPDLWTVLKRRRTTVSQFLEDAGIQTLSGLKVLVQSLKTGYNISNKFMTEANGHVLKKIAQKEQNDTLEEKTETKNTNKNETVTQKKPKTKTRKSSSRKSKKTSSSSTQKTNVSNVTTSTSGSNENGS